MTASSSVTNAELLISGERGLCQIGRRNDRSACTEEIQLGMEVPDTADAGTGVE